MDEKWNKFIFRVVVTLIGAVASYFTSTTLEDFALKAFAWVIIQAIISALAEAPVEQATATATVRGSISGIRKWLARL